VEEDRVTSAATLPSGPEIRVFAGAAALTRGAADEVMAAALNAVATRGRFILALSGGSTPAGLYALLAEDPFFRNRMPWDRIFFFWGDERTVPPGHRESNYAMADRVLLSKVPVRPGQIHRIRGEASDASEAAREYEKTIRDCLGLGPAGFPRFDLVLLGMGEDGHCASLFPGSAALAEKEHLAVALWVEKVDAFRITLTLPVLNHAETALFIVSGEEKAAAVRSALGPTSPVPSVPARLVRPRSGRLLWFLDQAAAGQLDR
jgi:6-phosphogluconolactonase